MSVYESIACIIAGTDGTVLLSFILMKLTGIVEWDWSWVMSPIWGPIFFFALFIAVPCIVAYVLKGILVAFIFIYKKIRRKGQQK